MFLFLFLFVCVFFKMVQPRCGAPSPWSEQVQAAAVQPELHDAKPATHNEKKLMDNKVCLQLGFIEETEANHSLRHTRQPSAAILLHTFRSWSS